MFKINNWRKFKINKFKIDKKRRLHSRALRLALAVMRKRYYVSVRLRNLFASNLSSVKIKSKNFYLKALSNKINTSPIIIARTLPVTKPRRIKYFMRKRKIIALSTSKAIPSTPALKKLFIKQYVSRAKKWLPKHLWEARKQVLKNGGRWKLEPRFKRLFIKNLEKNYTKRSFLYLKLFSAHLTKRLYDKNKKHHLFTLGRIRPKLKSVRKTSRVRISKVRNKVKRMARKLWLTGMRPRHVRANLKVILRRKNIIYSKAVFPVWWNTRLLKKRKSKIKKLKFIELAKLKWRAHKRLPWRIILWTHASKRLHRRKLWIIREKKQRKWKRRWAQNRKTFSITLANARSNYFLTITALNAEKVSNTVKVFSSGQLGVKTARKRRDIKAYSRLVLRLIRYLIECRATKIREITIKLRPQKRYRSAIKKKHIKTLTRMLKRNGIKVSKLRAVILDSHGILPRLPKRRRK